MRYAGKVKKITTQQIRKVQTTVWEYYRGNRREMPWRETRDAYKILVSEVMLQQTQVGRVVLKYEAFLKKFPTVEKLAKASMGEVLKMWQGLGYNRRALNLKKAAEVICEKFDGEVPRDLEALDSLPGVGAATAGAVAAYAFGSPSVFIETNIRRTFLHFFFNDADCKTVDDKEIFPLVEKTLDRKNPRDWYYALMDYGAMLKVTVPNPNKKSLHYTKQSKFIGSNREVRGKILKLLIAKKKIKIADLISGLADLRAEKNISDLIEEGFLKQIRGNLILAN